MFESCGEWLWAPTFQAGSWILLRQNCLHALYGLSEFGMSYVFAPIAQCGPEGPPAGSGDCRICFGVSRSLNKKNSQRSAPVFHSPECRRRQGK
jgi:hypothetical protein